MAGISHADVGRGTGRHLIDVGREGWLVALGIVCAAPIRFRLGEGLSHKSLSYTSFDSQEFVVRVVLARSFPSKWEWMLIRSFPSKWEWMLIRNFRLRRT